LKFSVGRYLNGEGAGAAQAMNPQNTVVNNASRAWSDSNYDFVPNCDLLNPDANGECGPISDRTFGKPALVSTTYDQDTLHGYGKRTYNWEISAGIQHELLPGVSVNATYFHRWYGNFLITKNLAVNPSDQHEPRPLTEHPIRVSLAAAIHHPDGQICQAWSTGGLLRQIPVTQQEARA
jgi:hypothetical protein